MTNPDQPEPAAAASDAPNLPATVPTVSASDDDIIDAEIVETPEPGASTEPGPAASSTGSSATAAPPPQPTTAAVSAPSWGTPPVPGVPTDPVTDYTDAGVPTLAYLQDKVEKRYATALGSHELADATIPEVQQAAKRQRELAKSAEERLAEIRRSLHPDG